MAQREESLHRTIRAFKSREDQSSSAQDIDDWSRHVLDCNTSQAALSEWTVVEVRWYKNEERLEHEFAVFTVQSSKQDARLYLRFDRRSTPEQLRKDQAEALVGKEDDVMFTESQKSTMLRTVKEEAETLSKRDSIFNSLKASSGKGDGLKPADTLTSCRHPNGKLTGPAEKSQLMLTYSDFQQSFSMRDLAVIAREVAAYSQSYLLLIQQCYWMARTLVNITTAMYRPQSRQEEGAFALAGKLSTMPFLGSVNQDNPQEVDNIINNRIIPAIKELDDEIRTAEAAQEAEMQARVAEQVAREVKKQLQERDGEILKLRKQLENLQDAEASV